jgi:arginine/lysine/ornithine decarboxylase
MDHSHAPVLEALQDFRDQGFTPFNPPGHRQGRGVDKRVLDVVGEAVFASDVIAVNGLDDRRVSHGVLARAQELMADAVGRISAEMLTPYPPGAPGVLPGEVITTAVLDYLRSGFAAGMQLPDPVDADLDSIRVVVR